MIVRVPDLAAVEAQRAAVANQVATDIQATLNDPQQRHRLLAAPPESRVRTPSCKSPTRPFRSRLPGLPDQARWVLTADLLTATNWPTLAARALRNAEAIAPSTARNPAVQHLAGIVAAQSGDREVFRASPTSVASAETLAAWKVAQPLTAPANAAVATTSRARDEDPSSRSRGFGFSLEGDLQEATGNTTAAETAYTQAAKIRPSPSLSRRMQKLQVKGRVPQG